MIKTLLETFISICVPLLSSPFLVIFCFHLFFSITSAAITFFFQHIWINLKKITTHFNHCLFVHVPRKHLQIPKCRITVHKCHHWSAPDSPWPTWFVYCWTEAELEELELHGFLHLAQSSLCADWVGSRRGLMTRSLFVVAVG